MNSVVDRIIDRDSRISVIKDGNYSMFYQGDIVDMWGANPGTLHIEEGMFFYGVVRLLKPKMILETGTNLGVAARFIGLALEDNESGSLITLEYDRSVYDVVCRKLVEYTKVCPLRADSMKFDVEEMHDMMFLDTEFNVRFLEMEKYWDHLNPGGLVFVHDGLSTRCERFGGFPEKLKKEKSDGNLVQVRLVTPHGMLMFQKGGIDYHAKYD